MQPSVAATGLFAEPAAHACGHSVRGCREAMRAGVQKGRLPAELPCLSCGYQVGLTTIFCPCMSSCCVSPPSDPLKSVVRPFLWTLYQPRLWKRPQQQTEQYRYCSLWRRQKWQQQSWELQQQRSEHQHQHSAGQHQQRRWYTPPSRRNWSKQHSKIFTRRPLTDNFAMGRLHPELEWFRERATQPVNFFMGFPDLEKIHLHGGASYINEMDAATLSIVLAAITSQGRDTSATSPAHLLQHNSPVIEQLGARAAALAATAPDPTLAYIFRGCAAAGVGDWAVVCTLVGYVEARLPRFSLHDVLVVLQGIRLARAPGSLDHFANYDDDVDRATALSPVYVHRPFVDKVVQHLELLLQYRNDVLAVELCAAATLLASLGYASAARMQFISGLLAQIPQQQLALAPPGALAAAMEVFARYKSELDASDCLLSETGECRALPPLLRAAAAPSGLEASNTQLILIFLVAPLLHRMQQTSSSGGSSSASRGKSRRSKSCRAGGALPALGANGGSGAFALKALTEAAATAAAAAVEEHREVRRHDSLLRHAVRICLTWAYERLEDLSVHHISKVLYAAMAARLFPSDSFLEDCFKSSFEHLGSCTPADLSRLFYAVVHAGESRFSADPVLMQTREYLHTTAASVPMLFLQRVGIAEEMLCTDSISKIVQERIQQALDLSLEACSPAALARVHSVVASAVRSSASWTESTRQLHCERQKLQASPVSSERFDTMKRLAQRTAFFFSTKLFQARPADLVTFLVTLRMVESDTEGLEEEILEMLFSRLPLLEPVQLASMLTVAAEHSQQRTTGRWRDAVDRLLVFLEGSVEQWSQRWHPETCFQVLLSLSRLPKEQLSVINTLAVALCDRLVTPLGGPPASGSEDPREQGSGDSQEDYIYDNVGECVDAISKQGMPSDELSAFSLQMSPLHWLGAGRYKQLIYALQELQVCDIRVREALNRTLAMKR